MTDIDGDLGVKLQNSKFVKSNLNHQTSYQKNFMFN